MADRRTVKTKQVITTTFIHLLQEKPLHQITVSEVARLADINRGTFYVHYQDIADLHQQLLDDTIADLTQLFNADYPNQADVDFMALFHSLLDYLASHKEWFVLFAQTSADSQVFSQIKGLFIEKVITAEQIDKKDHQDHVTVLYNVSGVMGVLSDWLSGKLVLSKSELVTIISQILERF